MVRYLSGAVRDNLPPDVGVMLTPMMRMRLPDDRVWAADTGCFSAPHKFRLDHYLQWLARHAHAAARCLFATAPDVYGDARATIAQSLPVLPLIRAAGFPAALVAQDGLEHQVIPWDAFDVLFVGGRDPWRQSGAVEHLVRHARQRGKRAHLGRVNSYKRLRFAQAIGCESADGTFVAFGADQNVERLRAWIDKIERQPTLDLL